MTQNIDFTPLIQKTQNALDIYAPITIDWSQNGQIPTYSAPEKPITNCPNLAEYCGPFKAVIADAKVGIFSFGYSLEGNSLWCTMCIFYESHSGGKNAMDILTFWYFYETETWVFKPANQK